MLKKPSCITELDFNLLKKKYNEAELAKVIEKIENDYPVQYAIGDVEFLHNKILVDERVLIPRFETELLVNKLIGYIKEYSLENSNILDLCTGSGCIAVALKYEFPKSSLVAVDISEDALNLAIENAQINGVSVDFRQMDILDGIDFEKKFSVLVSNPPYVKLDEEVSNGTKFEPSIALYPGEDDLKFYKKILESSKKVLTEKSIIAFEIGASQGEAICDLAGNTYPRSKVILEKDYTGLDRFVFVFNNCE